MVDIRGCIWLDIGPKFYRLPSPCPVHDLKVKIMDLEFLCESFMLKNASERKSAVQASYPVRRQVLLCTWSE